MKSDRALFQPHTMDWRE